jgi:hypothetical protein
MKLHCFRPRQLPRAYPGILLFTICAVGSAQSLIDPELIADARKTFEEATTAKLLHCGISPVRPALNFSLRFQTGYVIDVLLDQFRGSGHELKVLVRVIPEGGQPSLLVSTEKLPEAPQTKADGEIAGMFVVGEGAYRVEALVQDDLHRICQGNWRIQAKRSGSERDLALTTPPATVGELAALGPPNPERKSARELGASR